MGYDGNSSSCTCSGLKWKIRFYTEDKMGPLIALESEHRAIDFATELVDKEVYAKAALFCPKGRKIALVELAKVAIIKELS